MRFGIAASLFILALSACNPRDCQGGGFVSNDNVQKTVDNGAPADLGNALCAGANTAVNGDVNISNQAELNQMLNCKTVTGNVAIQNSTDIKDLSPLATLENIDQGYFLAFNNSALTTIELPALTQAAYGIGVIQNPALSAATFPAVVDATGDITVRDNASLTNLAFAALEQIRDDARFVAAAPKADNAGNLIIGNNPKLTDVKTFSKLDTIQGFMSVFGNDALQDFSGLELLTVIQNDGKAAQAFAVGIDFDDDNNIIAAGNKSLKDFTGLLNLETIAGDIFVGFNPALTSFSGFGDLTVHNNNIFVVGNDTLQDLSGLEGDGGNDGSNDGLQTVKGSIFIGQFFDAFKQPVAGGNKLLKDLTGLNNLTELDGSLVLAFNDQMSDFNGLDKLTTIGGDLVLLGSDFDDFKGADVLDEVKGNFVIGQVFGNDDHILNPVLDVDGTAVDPRFTVNLDAGNANNDSLAALTKIDKDLIIAGSDTGSLRLADQLATVTGRLIMHDSDLHNLTGFENVGTLGGLIVGLSVDKDNNFASGGNNNFNAFTGLNVGNLGAGGLAIGFNNNLANLNTLPVNNVAGSVTIVAENFTNLQGFDVVTIGGDLDIGAIVNGNNPPIDAGLDQMTALNVDNLTSVGGSVLVSFNNALTDSGFAALTTVTGKLEITTDGALAQIAGSNQVGQVGSLLIHDLPVLDTLNLPGLATVNQDLVVTNDPQLVTVDFNALGSVNNNLELTFLSVLPNLNFLAGLNTVGNLGAHSGNLFVTDDPDVADTSGLDGLQTVGGDVLFARCAGVGAGNFTLNSLTTVGGSFEIAQMDGLTDLTHQQGVTVVGLSLGSVGNALRIRQNQRMTSLAGLESLANIGLAVAIDNNPVLATIVVDTGQRHNNDQTGDVGLLAVTNIGDPNPPVVGVQGDRGVIDAQANPLLDENQLDFLIQGLTGFLGNQGCVSTGNDFNGGERCGLFFCGNQNQLGGATIDAAFDSPTCGDAAAAGGEGEGEGGQ